VGIGKQGFVFTQGYIDIKAVIAQYYIVQLKGGVYAFKWKGKTIWKVHALAIY
jgi:virulence-associated protein VapD